MTALVELTELDLVGKRVLVREDYNVPIKDAEIKDDTRIQASLSTINHILDAGGKIILVSHLGRPNEGVYDETLSLAPVAKSLTTLLGREVPLVQDWINGVNLENRAIILAENVRFEIGEKTNEDELCRKMAALCEVYVNDAFATAHRVHASTHGVAKYVPVAVAGPLLMRELTNLARLLTAPEGPVVAIVGGAKISSKLTALASLSAAVDHLIVGGGIANTCLKVAGYPIGQMLYEESLLDEVKKLLAATHGERIALPIDVVCAKALREDADTSIKRVERITDDDLILDIGPETTAKFTALVRSAKTIIWSGPLGVFEFDRFSAGTRALAEAVAISDAFSVAGGGDTLSAVAKFGLADKISYLSTGGSAFLRFLEGEKLPAVAILEESARAWATMEKAREY